MSIEDARRELERAATKLIEKRGDGYGNVDPKIQIYEVTGTKGSNGKTPFSMYWWGMVGPGDGKFGIRGQCFNADLEEYLKRSEENGRRVILVHQPGQEI